MAKTLKPHDRTKTETPEVPVDIPRTSESLEEELRLDRPSLRDWLDLRLGWYGFVRKNLDEPMPPGVGWWQTLGNLLMTLLIFQFVTGFALAMYYTPVDSSTRSRHRYHQRKIHPRGGSLPEHTQAIVPGSIR